MNPTQDSQYEQNILQTLTGLVGEYAGEVGAVLIGKQVFSLVRGKNIKQ